MYLIYDMYQIINYKNMNKNVRLIIVIKIIMNQIIYNVLYINFYMKKKKKIYERYKCYMIKINKNEI